MKWPRKVFFVLWLILVVWLVIWLYPFVHPLLQHPPKSGWLNALVHNLLTSQPQNLLSSPIPWVLLGVGGLMLLMMEIETRTRQLDTHGSAHHATRRERRPFVHAPRRFPRLGLAWATWWHGWGRGWSTAWRFQCGGTSSSTSCALAATTC